MSKKEQLIAGAALAVICGVMMGYTSRTNDASSALPK